jgi:hypothetical protein
MTNPLVNAILDLPPLVRSSIILHLFKRTQTVEALKRLGGAPIIPDARY